MKLFQIIIQSQAGAARRPASKSLNHLKSCAPRCPELPSKIGNHRFVRNGACHGTVEVLPPLRHDERTDRHRSLRCNRRCSIGQLTQHQTKTHMKQQIQTCVPTVSLDLRNRSANEARAIYIWRRASGSRSIYRSFCPLKTPVVSNTSAPGWKFVARNLVFLVLARCFFKTDANGNSKLAWMGLVFLRVFDPEISPTETKF